MDIARLGLAVDSSQVEKGTVTLHQLTGAAGQASAAAQRLAGASQAEAAGHKVAAAATQVHTAALHANNAAMRMNSHVRTNMIYQLNDVGVSLASGMSPVMVAIQQLPQMLQFGLRPAIESIMGLAKGLVTTFWPVAAVIGVATAAIAGLTYEINKTSEVQVGFFDVALAGWHLFAEGIGSAMAPVWNGLVSGLTWAWDQSAPVLKMIGNNIVGVFVGAYEYVKTVWSVLPTYFSAIGKLAWNELLATFEGDAISIGGQTILPGLDLTGMKAGLSPAETNAFSTASGSFGAAMGQDYMGAAFDALSGRAQEIALARGEVEELGGAAAAANDNARTLGDTLSDAARTAKAERDFYRNTFSGFFSDLKQGLTDGKGLWASFAAAATNALDSIINRLIDVASNSAFDMLMGSFMGGAGSFGVSASTPLGFGGTAGSYPAFPSFSGGGFTGAGPRVGGLDGRGGFAAMLHPNETVIDHSASSAANRNSVSIVRIELSSEVEGRILQQSAGQSVQIVRAAAPAIAEQGATSAGSKLAGGDFDRGMSRFGITAQARRR